MDISWSVFPGVSLPFPTHYVIAIDKRVYTELRSHWEFEWVWCARTHARARGVNVCFKYLIIVSRGRCHSAGSLQGGMSSDYLSCIAQKKKQLQPLPTFLWLSFLLTLAHPSQLYLIVAEHSYPSQSSLIHGFHFPHLPLPLFNVSILVISPTSSLAVFKAGFIPLYSSRHARDHLQQSRWSFCADKSTCEIHNFFFFFTYVCVFWSYTCKMTSTTARND